MADKRKNNRGTKGNKGGRPPKADELKFIEKLDNIIDSDEAIQKLKEMIKDNNFPALRLYIEYRFGKPKETVENINHNYNAELTKEEIKNIKEELDKRY